MKIMITGASGQLGGALVAQLEKEHELLKISGSSLLEGFVNVDLRDEAAVRETVERFQPDVVIHSAAYRDPDFCALNPEEAKRLNLDATQYLVNSLPASATFVFISSDYVFSGNHPIYVEEAERNPVNYYGELKKQAEDVVLTRNKALVIRFPVLIAGPREGTHQGFMARIVDWAMTEEEKLIDDVGYRFPTHIKDVAAAIDFLLKKGQSGIFHVSSDQGGTCFTLVSEIAKRLGRSTDLIKPSALADPKPGTRPINSQLSSQKLKALGFSQFSSYLDLV